VTNQLALSYPLTLNGGILSVGSLSGGTLLTVKTGTLNFNSALNFQAGGPLGTIIDIGTGLTISASSIFVGGPTRVVVSGGTLSSSGSISVGTFGELQLNGLTALVTSPTAINNSGIVHGNGMILGGSINNLPGGVFREETGERTIVNLLDNTGTINLLGGELDSLQFITNEATGHISGRGTLVTDTGLGNLGTIALSAGLSDFEGSISNVGTIIVSGGGTATFYDNVSNSGAAQFRVSTNSTVVFLGNVTGLAAFTGNGIKDFEGSASSGPILTTGSSIVGGSSSLSADSIRENALTVIGVARINPNGGAVGASHLNSLTIDGAANAWDGKLDLADNALVLDYSGASPLGTVLNQIITGFHNGDWHGNGITSSTAAEVASDLSNPHKTAVGYAEASALGISGTFVGQPFDNTSLLIRYTFAGDANLDGKVNALDFNALASNFGGASGKFWNQGDFNYDGVTNTLDFTVLGSNFNQALPSLALGTLVPEPAGVLIILAAFQFLLPRHRKVW
jgi:hypothetical protein